MHHVAKGARRFFNARVERIKTHDSPLFYPTAKIFGNLGE
jgi:hypothetical protein